MKTAISIPDPIFQSAEIMAQQLAISRSELFTKAISEYLEAHKYQDVTESLNQVYIEEPSSLDKKLTKMQFDSIEKLVVKRGKIWWASMEEPWGSELNAVDLSIRLSFSLVLLPFVNGFIRHPRL